MRKVLVVKMSSMGDVIHTLPALTDAEQVLTDIQFDWVVEKSFADIPAMHPAVDRIIPIELRRWRKHPFEARKSGEWQAFNAALQQQDYDAVIDAQGLLKSAWVAKQANGTVHGYDWQSAREPLASLLYQRRYAVSKEQHAITRVRELFAKSLGYSQPNATADYGAVAVHNASEQAVLLIHATARDEKCWPEAQWCALTKALAEQQCKVVLPWGNEQERQRAERIAQHGGTYATVLPSMTLAELVVKMQSMSAAVAVDTGLGHLAAALSLPTISLYGPTDPDKIGAFGEHQQHMRFEEATSDAVFQRLKAILQGS